MDSGSPEPAAALRRCRLCGRRHNLRSRANRLKQTRSRVNSHQKAIPTERRIDMSDRKNMTSSASESENPAIPSPTPKRTRPRTNKDWWPNQLDLSILHQHSPLSDPMGEDFNYAEEFKTLDLDALRRDLIEMMTTSREWWPADYGHY